MRKNTEKRRCECGGDCLRILDVDASGSPSYCRNAACIDARKASRATRIAADREIRLAAREKRLAARNAKFVATPPPPAPPAPSNDAEKVSFTRKCQCAGDIFKILKIDQRGLPKFCRGVGCVAARRAARKSQKELRKRPGRYVKKQQCECGTCDVCVKSARIAELQQIARARADEIESAAIAAGAEKSAARPAKIFGICEDCGGGATTRAGTRCTRCSDIWQTRQELESYFTSLTETEPIQRRLYKKLPENEIFALALCDVDGDAQNIMNSVIVRETKRIRETWTERDYAPALRENGGRGSFAASDYQFLIE